jgi:hypothetical protein
VVSLYRVIAAVAMKKIQYNKYNIKLQYMIFGKALFRLGN